MHSPISIWLVLLIVAAVALTCLGLIGFEGFDHLLKNGEPFVPYWVT
jgi:plastocyanin domain-containing protein